MEILNTKKNVVLGSKSPRRIEPMKSMGLDFKIKQLNVDEVILIHCRPFKLLYFYQKLINYSLKNNEILICADTIVYKNKSIYNKPSSNEDAQNMLMQLSNNQHFVVTGVTLRTDKRILSFMIKVLCILKNYL